MLFPGVISLSIFIGPGSSGQEEPNPTAASTTVDHAATGLDIASLDSVVQELFGASIATAMQLTYQ